MPFAIYPSLAGRVVLITGGASGIGEDMVRAFAANGAQVAFVDLQDDAGDRLTSEIADSGQLRPAYFHCDVTDIPALQAVISRIGRDLGPIGVLVNNAANDSRHAIAEITPDYWDQTQNVNLRHQFFAAQAVYEQMKSLGGGSIINFSSISWRLGSDQMISYATAKGAILAMTKALARSFGPHNIRVNAIEPGAVITERQKQLWFKSQADIDAVVERQLIKKVLLGEEIARLALFLAADDSKMITSQSLIIDAGFTGKV